jgi:outer membrane protein
MHRATLVGLIALGAFFLAGAGPAVSADSPKIGVVNIEKLLENSQAGKSVQSQLKAERDKLEADLKQKANDIQEADKRLQRETTVMSRETREEKERELRIKGADFQSLQKKYRNDLQDLERQLMGQLKDDINALVTDIGKKEGYTLIISNISVLYSVPSNDLTDRLIQELDAKTKKK